eukprot:SAG31_NODE_3480_length_4223_cov_23.570078_1_plen_75_part_00
MIVKGIIGGKSARILIDTGASISFVSLKFVKFSAVETVECEKLQIRLGDNSVTSVTKCFLGLIYMGDGLEHEGS